MSEKSGTRHYLLVTKVRAEDYGDSAGKKNVAPALGVRASRFGVCRALSDASQDAWLLCDSRRARKTRIGEEKGPTAAVYGVPARAEGAASSRRCAMCLGKRVTLPIQGFA